MSRALFGTPTIRHRCAALLIALVCRASPAVAQAYVVAQPMPGAGTVPRGMVTRVSPDGTRVAITALGVFERPQLVVLDTRTGATLFSSWTAPTAFDASRGTMSRDMTAVAYTRGLPSEQSRSEMRLYDLSTGLDRPLLSNVGSPSIEDVSDGGQVVAYTEWVDGAARLAVIRRSGFPIFISHPCLESLGPEQRRARLSADGARVVYGPGGKDWEDPPAWPAVGRFDTSTAAGSCLPLDDTVEATEALALSGDGRWVGLTSDRRAALVDSDTPTTVLVAPALGATWLQDVSDDGRYVLVLDSEQQLHLVDRRTGLLTRVLVPPVTLSPPGYDVFLGVVGHLSGDASAIVVTLRGGTAHNPRTAIFVARTDADGNGIHDGLEVGTGLNPFDPADVALDPDGDGFTTAEEEAFDSTSGTPRYFAEGANGAFFRTSFALFNTSTIETTARVRFLGADGSSDVRQVLLPASSPVYLDTTTLALPFGEFATIVDSPAAVAVERHMTWNHATRAGRHAATALDTAATAWFFAEGATTSGFHTFFLLSNPGERPATVTIRYLLPNDALQERWHTLAPGSRLTVWVNEEGPPLGDAEFGAWISADVPIVAERAMYRAGADVPFEAGSVAAGVTAPRTSWFFTEGATGAFFETYLLVANPGDVAARVTASFQRRADPTDAATVLPLRRTYVVPAHGRRTIRVAEMAVESRDAVGSTRVTSDQPVVAERSMWWPGPSAATWRGGHTGNGAAANAVRWAVAEVPVGGGDADEGFLLLAPTLPVSARARVSLSCEAGIRVGREFALPLNRTTLWMRVEFPEAAGQRCAALIESVPVPVMRAQGETVVRVPLVVESAVYAPGFAEGGVTLATRLPDPPE